MRHAKKIKLSNEKQGHYHFKQISRYDIVNALTDTSLPLSDDIHGTYWMSPPELLPTSGSGTVSYMFESLRVQIGGGKDRDDINKLHIQISLIIRRQSECDYPRGAMRNGLIDGTKCQAEERIGNLFLLLCIAQTVEGSEILQKGLQYSSNKWVKWLKCLKLYLSMEEWFHNISIITVPISVLIHPLCVFPESFTSKERFIVVLPKQTWSRYFGSKIK
jgi:hypothetical protein